MAVTINGTSGVTTPAVGVGADPLYPTDISVGSIATTANTQVIGARLSGITGNIDTLEISNVRGTAGSDWQTCGWRIQERVDGTWMGYIQFNGTPTGTNNGGISFGTGTTTTNANSISEKVRIHPSGGVSIGVTTDPGVSTLRLGRVDSASEGGQLDFCRAGDNAQAWYIDVYGSGTTNSGSLRIVDVNAAAVRASIDSAGVFAFDSGYGSAAPVYGCRAWVNFNGVTNGTFAGGTSTVTRVAGSTTATVTTTTNHNLHTGETVYVNFVVSGVAAGLYVVTVLSNTTFTITTAATTALTNFSITFSVSLIRGAGNVSSVADGGVGIYIVNFSTPMPDTNYAAVFGFGIGSNPGADANNDAFAHIGEQTIYSQYVYVESAADTSYDRAYMSVVIIR